MSDRQKELHFIQADLAPERYEDQYISRFGSRFSLQFHPKGRGVLPVGLGPINTNLAAFFAAEIDGELWSLPLQYPAGFDRTTRSIDEFSIHRSMTTAVLKSEADHPGIDLEWEFTSPFYPQDKLLSSAPFFYATARLRNRSDSVQTGRVLGGLENLETRCLPDQIGVVQAMSVAAAFRGPETKPGRLLHYQLGMAALDSGAHMELVETSCAYWQTAQYDYALAPGETLEFSFVLACCLEEKDIVSYHGEPCSLFYQRELATVEAVIAYAADNYAEALRKSRAFDAIVQNAPFPQHMKDFIYWNFHIYLGGTWLLRRPSGQSLYTNYEGGTGYFSTIDVEYNLAPFYASFWPELLTDQLSIWAETYQRGNRRRPFSSGPRHRIMSHDVGGGFVIDEQVYIPGPMPVEENCNYILLHYLYYRYTGDSSLFSRYRALCCELADYVLETDVSGTGLPDIGTNNTLDCFDKLLRDMDDQVFLGVKAGTALRVLGAMLEDIDGDSEAAQPYAQGSEAIIDSLEAEAWQQDHYVITISRSKPEGWDTASPLTTNGMAYLFFTGQPLLLDAERLRSDMLLTQQDYTLWPSMGVWRDLTAFYLGLRPSTEYKFRPDFRNDMYPRSFNAVAMLQAWAGIGVDVPNKRLIVCSDADGRFPLPMLADWHAGVVPEIVVKNGQVVSDGSDLLRDFCIESASY